MGGALALIATAAQTRDFNKLLVGEYSFTGPAACLLSSAGFNKDFTPIIASGSAPNASSQIISGTRTFNGDGTGSISAIAHSFTVRTTRRMASC